MSLFSRTHAAHSSFVKIYVEKYIFGYMKSKNFAMSMFWTTFAHPLRVVEC